ncbi:peptide/nickel transport system ATP-binding protein [Thermomonospora echinospora]|uniref:Peptide/nickel transport system ATP-binding protein n=1 Tax=Thermomonospora echinospora TaxID=1992 RepID=A0A1H6EB08_9ACTN|nr:ABC transporter ATP-binding protein [Thermomonospora echinospora]SEG93975.1 peptide/nickel transport system ATP-binding protein [Thermomonospora echinospora]
MPSGTDSTTDLLVVRGLRTTLRTPRGPLAVVDGADLRVPRRTTVGVVGESGSGKTMFARSLMNLLPAGAEVTAEELTFDDRELDPRRPPHRHFWGTEISMVFQDPMTALNPVRTVGAQICDPLRVHQGMGRGVARRRAAELLGHVGIPAPWSRLDQYPHELSGGMRQRVMIAVAISCEPKLLVADEPTTGLDVTVQRQILALLRRLKDEHGMAMLLISHDIALLADEVDQVGVMYAGQVVEHTDVAQIRGKAVRHRYTRALLQAHPDVNAPARTRLESIPGGPPDLLAMPEGCRFAARCEHAREICRATAPQPTRDPRTGAAFTCHFPHEPAEELV